MYYNIFCKDRVVIQPLMDINGVEVNFPSWPVKWRLVNFAFAHTEHRSPSKQSCWTRGKLCKGKTQSLLRDLHSAGLESALPNWGVCSLSGNCSNTYSQGRFYPTPFVSDVCLVMFKHFLLYLENSRSWLVTKISLLHMTCICTASMFHSTSNPK